MTVRSIKVWNASASAWEGVGVEAPDFGAFVGASLFNAKGDLLTATANDTPAVLTAGSNGQTLVADSSQTNGLRYVDGMIGRNAVINGNMAVWQRGTSFTGLAQYTANTADRWNFFRGGFATGHTITRQDGPTGFRYAMRCQRDSGNTSTASMNLSQSLETVDSIPFADKTVTISFWARAGANYSSASSALGVVVARGTGTDQNLQVGFTGANNFINTTATLTTSWQRFSFSGTAASTTTQLGVSFFYTPVGTASTNDWFEITGVQLEASPVATPFEFEPFEATLRKCQRYYYRTATGTGEFRASGMAATAAVADVVVPLPVPMRVAPTALETSGTGSHYEIRHQNTVTTCDAVPTLLDVNRNSATARFTVASGLTAGNAVQGRTAASGYIGWTAEL